MKKYIYIIMIIALLLAEKTTNESKEHKEYKIHELMNYSKIYDLYKLGYYGEHQNIVVIDTGVSENSSLKNRIIVFKDFINSSSEMYDDNGHGTEICEIIAGGNSNNYGVAPKANLIVLKAIDNNGLIDTVCLIQCIEWIIANKEVYNIELVCMSFGFEEENFILESMFDELKSNNILAITSVGNSGEEEGLISYPGCYSSVLSVGSKDYNPYDNIDIFNSKVAKFSSYKSLDKNKPEILAPGTNLIVNNGVSDNVGIVNGTSYSAALVTGQIAVLREKYAHLKFGEFRENMSLFINQKILFTKTRKE